jgi:beta-glucanase (GH16 family)
MSDFTPVFRDDFNGTDLNRDVWNTLYSGTYWNGAFAWDPSQVELGGGVLTIATERQGGFWESGGLSTIPEGQTYGSYEFRARLDEGQGTSAVILLWPTSNQWTDEVDIVEAYRADRSFFAFTNHGDPNETQFVQVDVSEWHDYRLDWTPGALVLSVDGQERSRITTDVPSQPMSFGMQGHVHAASETWFGGAPDGSTPSRVELEVDWVKVSAWTPGQGTDQPAQADAAPAQVVDATADTSVAADGGTDWLAAAALYVQNDGTWDGSWRNQVASGQITLEDVAARLQSGLGQWDFWH